LGKRPRRGELGDYGLRRGKKVWDPCNPKGGERLEKRIGRNKVPTFFKKRGGNTFPRGGALGKLKSAQLVRVPGTGLHKKSFFRGGHRQPNGAAAGERGAPRQLSWGKVSTSPTGQKGEKDPWERKFNTERKGPRGEGPTRKEKKRFLIEKALKLQREDPQKSCITTGGEARPGNEKRVRINAVDFRKGGSFFRERKAQEWAPKKRHARGRKGQFGNREGRLDWGKKKRDSGPHQPPL